MSAALVALVVVGSITFGGKALATGTTINGPASISASPQVSTPISGVSITEAGNPNVSVRLYVGNGSLAMGTTTGLTFTTPSSSPYTGGTLNFSGALSDVNTALATLSYTGTDLTADSLEISLTGPGEVYDPTNGHVYKYVAGTIDWPDAKTAADASSDYGVPGYLATLTSEEENTFVGNRILTDAWIGGSDLAVDGTWRWVDGPENGTQFWSEPVPAAGGTAVNGQYANWNPGEPNDGSGNGREDCLEYYSSQNNRGFWNDLPCGPTATLDGYLAEYGANGVNPSVTNLSIPITESASTVSVANCSQLLALDANPGSQFDTIVLTHDIDCTGLTVAPLFADTNNFPNGFEGTFNGQGHTISGYVFSNPAAQAGLFYATDGAAIENLNLTNGTISASYEVGAVVGSATATTISNVNSSWVLDCNDDYVGGLIGLVEDNAEGLTTSITNSSVTGNVTGGDFGVGGLVGDLENAGSTFTVSQTYVTGTVTGTNYSESVGGLVGYFDTYSGSGHAATATLQDVYTRGAISADQGYYVGGLIGDLENNNGSPSYASAVVIKNAYASGAVSTADYGGGLIGYADSLVSGETYDFENLFAAGAVTSPSYSGGIIGYNLADPSLVTSVNNYYDAPGTTQTTCADVSGLALSGCTSIDTVAQPNYFKGNHANQPMSAWNFAGIWLTNSGDYPTFGVTPAPTPTPTATPTASPSSSPTSDSDGIATAVENAAPNNGDANNDGIPDSQQSNVASYVNPVTNQYATLQAPTGCSITSVASASTAGNTSADAGYTYPLGMMNFSVSCGTPGYTATITQYYFNASATATYVLRKYVPATNAYLSVQGATYSQVTIGGVPAIKVTYAVTDGGAYDTDGSANGVIVDPAGLGVASVGIPNTGLGGGS